MALGWSDGVNRDGDSTSLICSSALCLLARTVERSHDETEGIGNLAGMEGWC